MSDNRPAAALEAYEQLASYYDAFTSHHDYEVWLGALLAACERFGLSGSRALDLACGTGKSFLPLLRHGWSITACDLSPAMLAQARAKVDGQVALHLADLRALPRFGRFDLVTCLDDGLNYLVSRAELGAALVGIARNLSPAGLALFDLNTLRTYRSFFAQTHAVRHGREQLVWRGEGAPSTPPGSLVTARLEIHDDTDRLVSAATHRQRHFRPEEVRSAIERAGLSCLALFGQGFDARLEQPLEEERHTKAIYIVAHKREGEERR